MINFSLKIIKLLSLASVLLALIFICFLFRFYWPDTSLTFYSDLGGNQASLNSKNKPSGEKSMINFLFFGDIMLDRHVKDKIKASGLEYLFLNLAEEEKDFFQGYDLIGANLEGAVAVGGAHYSPDMLYDFSFPPELVSEFKNYNFNFFNLANNHLADQGERGIIETRENLDKLAYNYSGCADGQVDECSAKIIEIAGKKIGLAGFSVVYKRLDSIKANDIISDLAEKTDLVIVNMHWGVEYEHRFNQSQQEAAHTLIDAGADVIIGHHPHVVQGIEIYSGRPIFYSLGNFIFDQYFSSDTQEGLAIAINLSEEKQAFLLYPFKTKSSQPELMSGEEKQAFLDKLLNWSESSDECEQGIKNGIIEIN